MYNHFTVNVYDGGRDHMESKTYAFKEFLKHELEHMFSLNDRRLNRSASNEAAEIAQIEIVFKNDSLVELYKQRGRALYDGDYERAQELTVEIRREAMQDARVLEEPHYAYVTFASEEGYARALNYTHRRYFHFFNQRTYEWRDQPVYCKPAPEPAAIIWENLFVTTGERLTKICFSVLTVLAILALSTFFIYAASRQRSFIRKKYPPTDCVEVTKLFDEGKTLKQFAVLQHAYLINVGDRGEYTSTSALQCFC